jgi:hypothetical protein
MHLNSVGRIVGVASAVVLAVSAASCRRQTSVPETGRLVGTWALTTESLELAGSMGFARAAAGDHQIVLSADGGCRFRSYWDFVGTPVRPREDDYIPRSAECSWRVLPAEVAARRSAVVGALEISVWEREPHELPRAASVDLQIEQLGGRLYLLATSGHPDDNGARFLYESVPR